jgi:hypothetical protein
VLVTALLCVSVFAAVVVLVLRAVQNAASTADHGPRIAALERAVRDAASRLTSVDARHSDLAARVVHTEAAILVTDAAVVATQVAATLLVGVCARCCETVASALVWLVRSCQADVVVLKDVSVSLRSASAVHGEDIVRLQRRAAVTEGNITTIVASVDASVSALNNSTIVLQSRCAVCMGVYNVLHAEYRRF